MVFTKTRLLCAAVVGSLSPKTPDLARRPTWSDQFWGNGQCWRATRALSLFCVISRHKSITTPKFRGMFFVIIINLVGTSNGVKSQKDPVSQIMTVRSLPLEGPRDKRLFGDHLSVFRVWVHQRLPHSLSSSLVVLIHSS